MTDGKQDPADHKPPAQQQQQPRPFRFLNGDEFGKLAVNERRVYLRLAFLALRERETQDPE